MPQTADLLAALNRSAGSLAGFINSAEKALDAGKPDDARQALSHLRLSLQADRDLVQAYADLPRAEKSAATGPEVGAKGGKTA